MEADRTAEREFAQVRNLIVAIRNIRSQYTVAPRQQVSAVILGATVEAHATMIQSLAGISQLSFEAQTPQGEYASAVVGDVQVFVSLEGLIDKEAEQAKLTKAQQETQVYIKNLEAKLANVEFTSKAPEAVVATMRQNLEEARHKLSILSLP